MIFNKKAINIVSITRTIKVDNYILYIQRRYVGSNAIAKLLQKGVSGSYTLNSKLILHFEKNKGVLPYYLIHFLAHLPNKKIETAQEMFDKISDLVISRDIFCDNPFIQPYGVIDNSKPFTFLYPFQQNYLAHATADKFLDIKDIQFSKVISNIDYSGYRNTGMTLHNLLEYKILLPVAEDFYSYLINKLGIPRENIKLMFNNPGISVPHTFGNNIQPNPDATVYYTKNGVEQPPINLSKRIPLDTKIIKDPLNSLEPLKGQISVTPEIVDLYTYINRLKGSLKNIKNEKQQIINVYMSEFDAMIKNLKKDMQNQLSPEKLSSKYLPQIYELSYKIWINPNITGVYPSILLSHVEKTNLMSSFAQKPFYNYLANGNHESMHNELFPVDKDYNYTNFLVSFLNKLPNDINKAILQDNLKMFLLSTKHLTQSLPWEI